MICLKKKNNQGFTLIELMIVIALIGALSAVAVNVVNHQRQREFAEDAVLREHLDQTVKAIEAYYTVERNYPDQGGAAQNPKAGSDSVVVDYYLETWATGLVYNRNASPDQFSIHVRKSSSTDYFKYASTWQQIQECADGTDVNSVTDCD